MDPSAGGEVAIFGARGTMEGTDPHFGMGPTIAAVTDRIAAYGTSSPGRMPIFHREIAIQCRAISS